MSSPFVKPLTKSLDLGNGQWIEVKHELNVGDQKRLVSAGVKRVLGTDGLQTELGWDYELERALVWITDWSFRDDAGEKVKVSRSALENLTPEVFEAVQDAISGHLMAITEEKKLKATPVATGGGSPSPS